MTQEPHAAAVALAQGDAAGTVPWNFKLSNGHWATRGDYRALWLDGRNTGGPVPADLWTLDAGQSSDDNGWALDSAHQPNLAYVPYLMTASRWYLDRLNAEAAWSGSIDGYALGLASCQSGGACDIVANDAQQVRAQAWELREIAEAAFIGKPGTFEQGWFNQQTADNFGYQASVLATKRTAQGETAAWMRNDGGTTGTWQEDFFTGVAELAAEMGLSGAQAFVQAQHPWLTGRFLASDMNPCDGCIYLLVMSDYAGTKNDYSTWSAMESATVTAGDSNGTNNSNNWSQSNGYYCPLARAVLGGALTVFSGDAKLTAALDWLNGSGAPYIDRRSFQNDPTYNVVPLQ